MSCVCLSGLALALPKLPRRRVDAHGCLSARACSMLWFRRFGFRLQCRLGVGFFARMSRFVVLACAAASAFASPPVVNVIAEPSVPTERVDSSGALDAVAAVAREVERRGALRAQTLRERVGAMLSKVSSVAAVPARPASTSVVTLNVRPPVEDEHEVALELDGVMSLEEAKRKVADAIFAGDKQRMLDVEREELQRIVHAALQ